MPFINEAAFPQEIFDIIIDYVAEKPEEVCWTHNLASLSLVSSAFRDRAHNYLFSSIEISKDKPKSTRTARQLAILFETPGSEVNGLASRIKSFSYVFQSTDTIPLVKIFRKLFRTKTKDTTHPPTCSLKLHVGSRWSALQEDLAYALYELCHRPRLAHLSLTQFQDIPRNFLRNTFIKRLDLIHTSLAEPLPENYFPPTCTRRALIEGHDQAIVLESLHTSNRFPTLQFLDFSPHCQLSTATTFSKLRTLTVDWFAGTERTKQALCDILLGSAASLQELNIDIYSSPTCILPLGQLSTLKSLKITAIPITIPGSTNFFSAFATLLDQEEFSPALQDIELTFMVYLDTNDVRKESVLNSLNKLHCDILDNLFARSQFDKLRSLAIQCRLSPAARSCPNADKLKMEAHAILCSQFPSISARKNLQFSVLVTE